MKRPFFTRQILVVLLCLVTSVTWAANTKTTVSQVTSSVTVAANTDYVITGTTPFGNQGSINIPSASMEHSVIIFQNIKPSVVISSYLSKVKINGTTASTSSNCQVKMYNNGAIVLPYGSSFKPLTCYTGTNFTGSSYNNYTTGSSGGYMKTLTSAQLLNNIKSFKLKRGYMVTFATGTAGWGYSRCFIADTEDLEMDLPPVLSGKVSSYRLFKWNDAQKKGVNEVNATSGLALGASWSFNWGIIGNLSPNVEGVPHKIHKNWPGVAECGNIEYSPHMKTDNEPANNSDDEPGTVDEVLGYWQDAMRTGMRLCSPSSHDGGYTWQEDFMRKIDARGWRCDILDMHCYWDTGSFSSLQNYYNKYKRPIWISELMYGASWNNNGAFASNRRTQSATLAGAQTIFGYLNSYPYVERYAWWNSEQDFTKVYNNGLTTVGEYFASMESGIAYNRNYEFVPVVVIKRPHSFTGSANGNTVSLEWSDSNGDMMDEIRVQYKLPGATAWTTQTTVTRKDKTGSGDQSYSYTGTVTNAGDYCWRIVNMLDGTEYPSSVLMPSADQQIDNLDGLPFNTGDYYFQFYSKEASSDMLWAIKSSSSYPNQVTYQAPASIGSDTSQLWTLEEDNYGGFTLRNLSTLDYVMCSPASWDFNTNNSSYTTAAESASYLPEYHSDGDYWVLKNLAHGTYVGLWDNDKNFGIGERLAGNRTYVTGNDSGDKIGLRAIPRSIVNEAMGFTGVEIPSGTYYLYNQEAGQFISAGADWGTRSIASDTGIDFALSPSSNQLGYLLESNISNNSTDHYLGSNLYTDAPSATWIFAEAGTSDGRQAYTLTVDGSSYLATNGAGAALTTLADASNARCKWILLTKADLVSRMSAATEASPVDATFLLRGYNFSRNDGRNALWQGSPGINGDATNMNGEKFSTTFDVYQELNVPNGIYKVAAQGFYRDGGYADAATKRANGTETLNAEFYANDVTHPVPSIFDEAGKNGSIGVSTSQGYIPNGQGEASSYLTNGLYSITPMRVEVTDGILRIGVRKSEAVTNDWTLFDNFSIIYLGNGENNGGDDPDEPVTPEDTRYPDALAAAKAARDANEQHTPGAAQSAIDEFEWTDAERATKTDEEIETAITVLTNGAAISIASQVATGLIQNADFTGGTNSMATQNGGGRVQYPLKWIFIREYSGWNDTFVENGIFNAWAGTITHAELYQALTGLPNGTYRLTADVRVDNPAPNSQTALYGTGSGTGRSEEAGSDIAGSTEGFASYSCSFEVTNHTAAIGIRSNHSFYQIKNIALEYVTDTIQAAREVADSRLRQDFFWSTDPLFDATASADYANASDVLVYPRLANQLIKATSARQFRHQTNIIVNGTCQNLVITDEQPLSIPEPFTAATLTYDRNDAADGWRELFVPFAIPKSNGLDVGIITGFSITGGDITDDLSENITNASFDTGTAVSGNQAATDPGTNGNVDGWTLSGSCGWSTSGLFAYGSGAQLNGSTVPTSGPAGSASTQALGISVGWGNTVIYSQTVSALPAGDYVLSCKEYNVFNVTQMRSLFGVIVGDGSYLSEKTSFASGTWETETISFTLTEATDVTIQVGAQAVGGGSTNNAKVLFDDVMLMGRTPLSLTATGEELTTTAPNVPSVVKFTNPTISLTDVSVVPTVEYSDNDGLHGIYTAGHNVSPLRWYIAPDHRLSEFALNLTLPFDVEEDGELNGLDVAKLATILVNGLQGDYRLSVLDVDGNGFFSLSDITALVNLIRQQ